MSGPPNAEGLLTPGTLKSLSKEDINEMGWGHVASSMFNVRQGPGYRQTGKKAPSEDSLYEIYAIDAYKSPKKCPHFGQYVDIPFDPDSESCGIPTTLIINLMVPRYAPSYIWGSPGDGESWCAVFYCRLSDASRASLKSENPSPSCRLLKRFIHAENGDPLRRRFKCIGRNVNPEACGFSSATRALINKYNAKPFVVRDTSSFYLTERYFEVDIDVHRFGKPARIGLYGCSEVLTQMIFEWAFVVEGEDDDELPEQILCSAQLSHLNPSQIIDLPSVDKLLSTACDESHSPAQDAAPPPPENVENLEPENADELLAEDESLHTPDSK